VEDRVGGDGFGDNVARALSPGVRSNVIADENDHAASLGGQLEEVLGGEKYAVVDVCSAASMERIDLVGDFRFVFRERDAHLGFRRKGEERGFVIGLESCESGVRRVAERSEEWSDRVT